MSLPLYHNVGLCPCRNHAILNGGKSGGAPWHCLIKSERFQRRYGKFPSNIKRGLVPARIYATEKLQQEMDQRVFEQVTNVACLPGVLKYAYCMPDGHWGYVFPMGGMAAMAPNAGVISPGGIGFEILIHLTFPAKNVRA